MTATALRSLSDAPPMLLCCANASASAHPLMRAQGSFSVNLLAEEQAETGAPMERDAVANFDCGMQAVHVHATHSITVGTVRGLSLRAGTPLLI
ncbi:flavin reductase family protein [Roseomonas sp. ACRSG]|nr:flavin reductase family protein [Roseomonas sp. ACRSG]